MPDKQVSYEQAAIVKHVVTSSWGWEFIKHVETDQQLQTAFDSKGLKMNVLRQRDAREAEKLRTVCVRPKSKQEQLYSARVTVMRRKTAAEQQSMRLASVEWHYAVTCFTDT